MSDYNNAKIITDVLSQAMAAATPEVTKSLLQTFVNQLNNYLQELNSFYEEIGRLLQQAEAQYANCGDVSETTITYSALKKIQYSESQIDSLLKTGFALIEQIRYQLTQDEILYQIGLPSKGGVDEITLHLDQLLEYTRVSFNTKGKIDNIFKLRMYNKAGLRNSIAQSESSLNSAESGSSTVWSSISHYIDDQHNKGRVVNKGNAYEVYSVIVHERQSNHLEGSSPPSADALDEYFSATRSNTASFVQGGDYGSIQMKYFSSAPSIATTNTIRTSLTEISNDFQQYIYSMDSGSLTTSLISLFTKRLSSTANEIDMIAKEDAEEHIREAISQLGLS